MLQGRVTREELIKTSRRLVADSELVAENAKAIIEEAKELLKRFREAGGKKRSEVFPGETDSSAPPRT